jgi:high-affinity iron transporter
MKEHGGNLKSEIESQTSLAALGNGQKALFVLSFLAVFREGIELALFLLAARLASSPMETLTGALLGLAAAIALGWVFFTSTRKLSLRNFFSATNIMLIIFAAGMVGLGVHELNEAGVIPAVIEHVWDFNPVINEQSEVGLILKALVGYNGNPSLTAVTGYMVYLIGVVIFFLLRKRDIIPMPGQSKS